MKTIDITYFEQIEDAYKDSSGGSCNWADSKIRELRDYIQDGNKIEIQDDQNTVVIETVQELIEWKSGKNFPAISFNID